VITRPATSNRPMRTPNRRARGLEIYFALGCLLLPPAIASPQMQGGSDKEQQGQSTASQNPRQAQVTFKLDGPLAQDMMTGDNGRPLALKTKDGKFVYVFGRATWATASDGERVHLRDWGLVTKAFASRYLADKLTYAQILSREPRTNSKGETIGERIVALLFVPSEPHKRGPNDPHKYLPAVIRTNGTLYSEFTCDSLDDVLAFEKSYPDIW
jgi:hypothetical protein